MIIIILYFIQPWLPNLENVTQFMVRRCKGKRSSKNFNLLYFFHLGTFLYFVSYLAFDILTDWREQASGGDRLGGRVKWRWHTTTPLHCIVPAIFFYLNVFKKKWFSKYTGELVHIVIQMVWPQKLLSIFIKKKEKKYNQWIVLFDS